MFENIQDTITPSGLDTLSERALRRLTDRWTGTLYDADTLLDARSATQATTSETFSKIVGEWREAREVYHPGSLADVMGESASLAEGVYTPAAEVADSLSSVDVAAIPVEEIFLSGYESASGVGEWMPLLYDVLIVGALIYYMYCLYRYFDDIMALFHSVFQSQVVANDRNVERRRSDIFYGALGKLFMMGMCFVGLLVALYVRRSGYALSAEQLFYLPFVTIAVYGLVMMVQYLLLNVVGFITHSFAEVAALIRIRLIYFVLASIMVAPIMLVGQMGEGASYLTWQNIAFGAAIIAFVMFVRESLGLFISKKVSILHWFLYLCTVEILPFTLLWQGVVRLA